jgi:hypothetical protein
MIVTPSPSALVRTAFAAALLVTALLAAPA